jgi:hypothetical protein
MFTSGTYGSVVGENVEKGFCFLFYSIQMRGKGGGGATLQQLIGVGLAASSSLRCICLAH